MEQDTPKPAFNVPIKLFEIGRVVTTPGAIAATDIFQLSEMLKRHLRGDWGMVCKEDRRSNFEALKLGNRILSAYPIDKTKPAKGCGENVVWIITEADRSVTTFLLPSEY